MSIGVSKQHDVAKLHLLIRKSDCLVPYVLCLPLYLRALLSPFPHLTSNFVEMEPMESNGIALTRSARCAVFSRREARFFPFLCAFAS